MRLLLGCWRLWFVNDGLSLALYDGSDAVAWLVRRLGGGCRLACNAVDAMC
jgi:hypothetical protein